MTRFGHIALLGSGVPSEVLLESGRGGSRGAGGRRLCDQGGRRWRRAGAAARPRLGL